MTAGESSRPGNPAREEPGEDLPAGIEEREIEDVEEHSRLRVPVIYEVVRREGETEMRRPATSLWWSGVAAGLSISFSLLGQAALNSHLPDVAWRPLVSGFGYSIGFLIAVLARQQLFTKRRSPSSCRFLPILPARMYAACCGCGRSCLRPISLERCLPRCSATSARC